MSHHEGMLENYFGKFYMHSVLNTAYLIIVDKHEIISFA